ncbi:MAG: DUF3134 domain-containing protein [Merismopedia sp. SIO2A8]|nr:DUF3134 domain-containing protein [Symploca sp. SIO2B6]NET53762.1 DUF3134 domain-containing protein [Merismopedia sp. SIO2A8]
MNYNNPALRVYSRKQHAPLIPLQRDASILEWLERSGRMMERVSEVEVVPEEDAEINALMGNDDGYDDDDDDSLEIDD